MAMLKRLLMVLVAVLLIAVPTTVAQGAPGGGPGRPPDAGGGGGGGGNPNKGPGQKLGDLYADLMVIARYADGTPITVTYEGETCVQPITSASAHVVYDEEGNVISTVDFDQVGTLSEGVVYDYDPDMYYIPLVGLPATAMAEEEDEDELEPCDVQADYAYLVEEVDLGRLNLGRAPDRVLTKQLRDVQLFLTSGDIALDASGRFTRSIDDVVVQTLDSPLANLAVYQSILKTGAIGAVGVPTTALTEWELTAAQLAAGAPKEDFVITVDTVQYLNRILGIQASDSETPWAPTILGDTGEWFVDYSGVTFFRPDGAMSTYDRAAMFPGNMCFYDVTAEKWMYASIMSHVFGDVASTDRFGIGAYVQFAEDAHKVLVEVHRLGLTLEFVSNITENTAPEGCGDVL